MSPVFCATAAPISEPFTIIAVAAPTTNEKSTNAAYAPHAFATRNCTRVTGCESATAAVPLSNSRRTDRTAPTIANSMPPTKSAESPASRAMRDGSPNWW